MTAARQHNDNLWLVVELGLQLTLLEYCLNIVKGLAMLLTLIKGHDVLLFQQFCITHLRN